MARGTQKLFTTMDSYHNADKDWVIELQESNNIWYDLIANPNEYNLKISTKKIIVDQLKSLKKEIESNLEKRFIYFICTRTKVRFNIQKKVTFNSLTKKLTIHLLIGKNKIKKSIKIQPVDLDGNIVNNPKVEITEKFITIFDEKNFFIVYPIHDLLSVYNIKLNIYTNVHYVGYTKNPDTRPTNGAHSGFNDVLYNVSHDDNDIFIFFNIFKVTAVTRDNNFNKKIIFPNSMSDEINLDDEGLIIEKCLILYFNSQNQIKNRKAEKTELENYLINISNNKKIKSIQFHYEFEKYNEYWKLYSSRITASMKHLFSIEINNDLLDFKLGSVMISDLHKQYNKSERL